MALKAPGVLVFDMFRIMGREFIGSAAAKALFILIPEAAQCEMPKRWRAFGLL